MPGGFDGAEQLSVTLSPVFARFGPMITGISGPSKQMNYFLNHLHLNLFTGLSRYSNNALLQWPTIHSNLDKRPKSDV